MKEVSDHSSLVRIKSFNSWRKNKILILHMESLNLGIEDFCKSDNIPFLSLSYEEPNIEEILPFYLNDSIGVIITGSVKRGGRYPEIPEVIMESPLPKLGICYGAEYIGHYLGANIIQCNNESGESGVVLAEFKKSPIFENIDIAQDVPVVMAHHLMLDSVPRGCRQIASTDLTEIAGYENENKKIFGLQFHPEKNWLGDIIFRNFYNICKIV